MGRGAPDASPTPTTTPANRNWPQKDMPSRWPEIRALVLEVKATYLQASVRLAPRQLRSVARAERGVARAERGALQPLARELLSSNERDGGWQLGGCGGDL